MNILSRPLFLYSLALLVLLSSFFLTTSRATVATAEHRAHTAPRAAHLPQTWNIDVGVQLKVSATEGRTYSVPEIWINVGDTITWQAASDLEHTVTFMSIGQTMPTFNPHNTLQTRHQGSNHYDGHSYYNSGLMSNFPPAHPHDVMTYSLTFDQIGDFPYGCLPHPAMTGMVHVRPAGTPYPFTAHDYYQQSLTVVDGVRQEGQQLAKSARKYATNHFVVVGVGNTEVSDFTFTPQLITIHADEMVAFQYADSIEEHTVTFGYSTMSNQVPYGNPSAFDGTTAFNSGWLCASDSCSGTTFQVRFMKPGTFVLRDDLNKYTMFATVIVLA